MTSNSPNRGPKPFRLSTHAIVLVALALTAVLLLLIALPARGQRGNTGGEPTAWASGGRGHSSHETIASV